MQGTLSSTEYSPLLRPCAPYHRVQQCSRHAKGHSKQDFVRCLRHVLRNETETDV